MNKELNMAMAIREKEINHILEGMNAPFRVKTTKQFKNNTMMDAYILDGLEDSDEAIKCSPILYLGPWWEMSNEEFVDYLIDIFENDNIDKKLGLLVQNKDYMMDHMHAKLTSAEYLSLIEENDIVAVPYLDMLITFYSVIEEGTEEKKTVSIDHKILDSLDLNMDEIMNMAMENVKKECHVISMTEFFDIEEEQDMHIITNQSGLFGASCLLCPDLISDLEKKMGDKLYLLPSSLHEIIAVLASSVDNVNSLAEIVSEINGSGVVREEDVLTNSVYELADGKIQICK